MTIPGGLLTLVAAGCVAVLSRRDRWLQRNLYRLGDQYARELQLHSQAYQAYGNQQGHRDRTGQGPVPVRPFDGMDEKAHCDQLTTEHFRRVQARTGAIRRSRRVTKDVRRDVLDELYRPGGRGAEQVGQCSTESQDRLLGVLFARDSDASIGQRPGERSGDRFPNDGGRLSSTRAVEVGNAGGQRGTARRSLRPGHPH
jgi:hypothetical protein